MTRPYKERSAEQFPFALHNLSTDCCNEELEQLDVVLEGSGILLDRTRTDQIISYVSIMQNWVTTRW